MDKMLQGLDHVICYQDDILVTGDSQEDHLNNLDLVFQRLRRFNVALNFDKCKFMQTKIEYLGHQIDCEGIHPTSEKIAAIQGIKSPQNMHQLRSFLGLLNYYVKFIKNASTLLHPLNSLLRKDQQWLWSEQCEKTFKKCKGILTSEIVLVHYDQNKPLRLQCDASPYGLGAILSHQMATGEDKPIAYASRTLTQAEANYSQIEREALSIIFGLKKFQQYIFGRKFTIITDHRPLITLLGPQKATPAMAAARIQRWSLLLSSFDYQIEYKKGNEHTNADTLSRLPIGSTFEIEGNVFKLSFLEDLPVSAMDIANATRVDPVLGRLCNYIKYGWQTDHDQEIQPYYLRREELSFDRGVVLWGMRVVMPPKYRDRMLELLHDTHPGIVRMKAVARGHFWWPHLDREIEKLSNHCGACSQHLNMPPTTPLQSWIWPKAPWERIHIDFAQKRKDFYLITVDGHSKWVEVAKMTQTTSLKTMEKLREMFARYGIPMELVSDNGPQLVSEEFKTFLMQNGIKQTLVPTYHPKSNGAAEQAVKSFKKALEKMQDDPKDNTTLEHKISRYLMVQHSTPHTTTAKTPAELFLKRNIRTLISQIHVNTAVEVETQQFRQKENHDRAHNTIRTFDQKQDVLYKQGKNHEEWRLGKIVRREGNNTWKIECNGKEYLAHTDQLRSTTLKTPDLMCSEKNINDVLVEEEEFENSNGDESDQLISSTPMEHMEEQQEEQTKKKYCRVVPTEDLAPQRKNPIRIRKKPDKLNL